MIHIYVLSGTLDYIFHFHAACELIVRNLKTEKVKGIDLLSCKKKNCCWVGVFFWLFFMFLMWKATSLAFSGFTMN